MYILHKTCKFNRKWYISYKKKTPKNKQKKTPPPQKKICKIKKFLFNPYKNYSLLYFTIVQTAWYNIKTLIYYGENNKTSIYHGKNMLLC